MKKLKIVGISEFVESLSQAGKLTGKGNGMQYFGAMLIRSELSLEELKTYYSGIRTMIGNTSWKFNRKVH